MVKVLRVVSTLDPVEAFAEGLPNDFLLCRDTGHWWKPLTARYDAGADQYEQTFLCQQCSTERDRFLTRDGYIARAGRYRYPEGYVSQGVTLADKAGRAMVRRVELMRSA